MLLSVELAERAIKELDNAPLFDRRLKSRQFEPIVGDSSYINISFGWYASRSPILEHVQLRAANFKPPSDIFAPMRESRRVIVDNLPNYLPVHLRQRKGPVLKDRIYAMFHSFDVLCTSRVRSYKDPRPKQRKFLLVLDFQTPEEADMACNLHDGHLVESHELAVAVSKPPMRHIAASWDGGKAGYHNSLRDTGSAVGTNFGKMRQPSG